MKASLKEGSKNASQVKHAHFPLPLVPLGINQSFIFVCFCFCLCLCFCFCFLSFFLSPSLSPFLLSFLSFLSFFLSFFLSVCLSVCYSFVRSFAHLFLILFLSFHPPQVKTEVSLLDSEITETPHNVAITSDSLMTLPSGLETSPHSRETIELCSDSNLRVSLQKVWKADELVLVVFLTNQSQNNAPLTDVTCVLETPSNLLASFDSGSNNRLQDNCIEPAMSVSMQPIVQVSLTCWIMVGDRCFYYYYYYYYYYYFKDIPWPNRLASRRNFRTWLHLANTIYIIPLLLV